MEQLIATAAAAAGRPPVADGPSGTLLWGDVLIDQVVELAAAAKNARDAGHAVSGLPTGHAAVDRLLNGLQGAGLYLLGGAPGKGKTTPALGSAARARATGGARLLDLLVAKNRYGEADYRVPLLFNAPIGEFSEETPV